MPANPLAGGPATLLYYAAIAAASNVSHDRITRSGAQPLQDLFLRAMKLLQR